MESLKDFEQKINSDLAEIAEWLKVNKLTLNVDKTVCMVFTNRHKENEVNIKLEGRLINRVTKTKFLGVIIDDKLNWKAHISYISGKISRAIGVIIKTRNLGKGALLSLYYTLIYPYLTYCNQVWGSTYEYNIDTLTKLQKKAVKVTEICHFLVGQFMFRYHHKILPKLFDEYFTKHSEVHGYSTRQLELFRLPDYKKDLGRRSISFTGVKMWKKNIVADIDLDTLQPVFKINL